MEALARAKAKLRGLHSKPTVEQAKQALRSKQFDIEHFDLAKEVLALFSVGQTKQTRV